MKEITNMSVKLVKDEDALALGGGDQNGNDYVHCRKNAFNSENHSNGQKQNKRNTFLQFHKDE